MRSRHWGTIGLVALALGTAPPSHAVRAQAPAAAPASGTQAVEAGEAAARANNLGVARLEQFDYAGATEEFRRALQLAPDFDLARTNLAIALFYNSNLPEADREVTAVLRRAPDSPQANYLAGLMARTTNDPDKATAAFRRVLAVDPDDVGAKVGLGQVLLQARQFAEATTLFESAARTEPFNLTASYNYAFSLIRSGRADEGREAMARFQALRDSGTGMGYSNSYLEQGHYAEALVSTGLEPRFVSREPPAVSFEWAYVEAPPAVGPNERVRPSRPTLADLDGDGDLDIVLTGAVGTVLRNDGGRFDWWQDTGIPLELLRSVAGTVVADCDNDGAPDVVVLAPTGPRLLIQARPGHFEDRTQASGVEAVKLAASTAALADVDHDGDLDLVLGGAAGMALLRNNGKGAFVDVTAAAKLAGVGGVRTIVPTDIDNRRDLDLVVAATDGTVKVLHNDRDGTFSEQAERFGVKGASSVAAIAAADVNKDDLPDLILAGSTVSAAVSRGTTLTSREVAGLRDASAVLVLDYDGDGLLDAVTAAPDGLHVARFVGDAWQDVTSVAARPGSLEPPSGPTGAPVALAAGDLDGDGATDLVVGYATGEVIVAKNTGKGQRTLAVSLTGRTSNRSGIGAKVEVRAGSLRGRLDTVAATPSPAPADLRFGLGGRASADVVRVLWPSGVLQAEVVPTGRNGREALALTELDRKPSSCPFLYTWNGERFEFVTDFLGGGEMGAWVAPGVRGMPDPDEYVRIPMGALVPRDGRYELRVTNELEESLYLDRVQLLTVTHPPGTEVFVNEGLRGGPPAPFTIYVARDLAPVHRATDDRGRDVTDRLARIDRRYVDDLPVLPVRGYASRHALTLDLGPDGHASRPDPNDSGQATATASSSAAGTQRPDRRFLLLLTGWTDYAFSSDNVAAAQAGYEQRPPSLQVRDAAGEWRTVIDEIGLPVGRPQTVAVDLTGKFLSASREVRVLTTMRVYWDEARVARDAEAVRPDPSAASVDVPLATGRLVVNRVEPLRADLSWRGFSAESRPTGDAYGLWPMAYGPWHEGRVTTVSAPTYDYDRVSTASPWKQMPGRYTRFGDVRELLGEIDDRFVRSRPGDEIALAFPVPASAAGGVTTCLLFAHGYSKEMDINSGSPDTAAPWPYRGMTRYPYASPERFPATATHLADEARYHTRYVGRPLPPLDGQ